jgi:hypothetical protein
MRAYYVSVRDERGRTILALGPFAHHRRALGLVDAVRLRIMRAGLDPWAEFGYGTCSLPVGRELAAGAMTDAFHAGPDMAHVDGYRMPAPILAKLATT